MYRYFIFILTCLLLVACSGEETAVSPPPTPLPTAMATAVPTLAATIPPPAAPTAIPTTTTVAEPVATVAATATIAPTVTPETAVSGRDASGAFYYGNPNADVVLIDFSDFL